MARLERVAFGLLLASSSSELMNARMTSLESPSPPGSMASLSYSSSVSLLSALALLSEMSYNFLYFLILAALQMLLQPVVV